MFNYIYIARWLDEKVKFKKEKKKESKVANLEAKVAIQV
jgi:hypothetical protein